MTGTGERTRGTIRRLVTSPLATFPLVTLLFTVVVGAGVLFARAKLRTAIRAQVAAQLEVTRDTSAGAVTSWFTSMRTAVAHAVADPAAEARLHACLAAPACDVAATAGAVRPYLAVVGIRDLVVVDRQGRVRGVDGRRPSAWQLPRELALAIEQPRAEATLLPAVLDAGTPTLWVGAPITAGGARAGMVLAELPIEGLDQMLHVARAGTSGETYAFDRQGRLLSQSRFASQLRAIGLLESTDPTVVLTVDVRDPGVDLTRGSRGALPRAQQPLTRMARDAVAGGRGVDIDGYRDYRGVNVVGAWQWLPELDLGIATEADTAEAFEATSILYRIFRWLLALVGVTCLALVVGAAFLGRLRARAVKAQQVAERFGQYRIVRKLAEGGMGAVYLADHELLRRPAVVKLVRPDRVTPDAYPRFEREARLTSTLTHPNTVAIFDYGLTDDGTPYYVMELVDGLDLERLVARFGPVPQARVIHLVRQLCGSLAEAHEAGLVHRDIKPANLMVCRRGGASDLLKVLDFGTARSFTARDAGLTEARLLVGTPAYMAPELFESAASASPQADLYAVGCVAYFLLTGVPVFGYAGDDVSRAHLIDAPEPPSARMRATVDTDLEAAILACLAKRRDARPQSAAALRAMLDRAALAHPWTDAQADAWWIEHATAVEATREALVRPLTLRRVRPKRSA